jgi:hypothetical protein
MTDQSLLVVQIHDLFMVITDLPHHEDCGLLLKRNGQGYIKHPITEVVYFQTIDGDSAVSWSYLEQGIQVLKDYIRYAGGTVEN